MSWTAEHQSAARAEGWGLFHVVDNGRPLKEMHMRILTDSTRFRNGFEASTFVMARAKQRSDLHLLALQVAAASLVRKTR